ncbi:MAG: sigma factor G inhibitor Gin [Clostridium sp.]|uniref:sigma factor G inhibitor Gin n=1 Tax=Clostridium sp. TaxID=1506 RepID=UPI003EE5B7C2
MINNVNLEKKNMYELKNKEIDKRRCVICEKSVESCLSENEINGIIINGEYICRQCEREIVEMDVTEKKYDDYKERIKVVIYR